ncbi:hypothetical protein FI667_g13769, partial [Globisporangium splendens]
MAAKTEKSRHLLPVLPPATSITRVVAVASPRKPPSMAQVVLTHHRVCTLPILWTTLAGLHLVCAAFGAVMAAVYATLPDTWLSQNLSLYSVSTVSLSYFPIVAVCYALLAAMHAWCLGQMILWSVRDSEWVLTQPHKAKKTPKQSNEVVTIGSSKWRPSWEYFWCSRSTTSPYFGVQFLAREVLETVLQSVQAYQMSRHVPRLALNRFYVVLLTLNCWSTPLILVYFRKKDESGRQFMRLLLLCCDVLLDFTATVGVPVSLAITYLPAYDFSTTNFTPASWEDDVWIVNWWNEFQLLPVQSWLDLGMRIVFSLSLLSCVEHIKALAVQPAATLKPSDGVSAKHDISATDTSGNNMALVPVLEGLVRLVDGGMVLWGITILALHLQADHSQPVPGCRVVVRPWLTQKQASSLLDIDVRQQPEYATLTGSALEIEAVWSQIEPSTLLTLNFANIPKLSIPPTLHNFHALIRLTIQNGSLAEWDVNAALTNTHHPNMHSLALVAVALPFDERDPHKAPILPPGLVASTDFPTNLLEIRIEACNLTCLPVDLDTKWPRCASLNLRNNALESIPDVFHRLTPVNLLLQGNRIVQIPKSLFAWPALAVLDLSRNPLTSIVETSSEADARDFVVTDSLRIMSFSRSLLVDLPEWLVTPEVLSHTRVFAVGTPLCQDVLAKKRTATFDTTRVICVA